MFVYDDDSNSTQFRCWNEFCLWVRWHFTDAKEQIWKTLALKIPSKMCQVLMFETGTTDFFFYKCFSWNDLFCVWIMTWIIIVTLWITGLTSRTCLCLLACADTSAQTAFESTYTCGSFTKTGGAQLIFFFFLILLLKINSMKFPN